MVHTIMINISKPFILYANCSIVYDGRAYSTLAGGHYLIIYKSDGSLLIHGKNLCKPLNYQPAGSKLTLEGNIITSINKKEKIVINITEIINIQSIDNWSDTKIEIKRTEKELVDKLFNNWDEYIDGEFAELIREYHTEHGPIDLLGIASNGVYHAVEVKRKKASISNGTQLKKYVDAIVDQGHSVIGYLASPEINDNVINYLNRHGFKWIKVEFDYE